MREAIRATTAAPTYFYPLVRRGMVHSDGALLANNPTAIAIHEAKVRPSVRVCGCRSLPRHGLCVYCIDALTRTVVGHLAGAPPFFPLLAPHIYPRQPTTPLAQILYPNVPIEAVVSFGTGNPLEAQPVEGFGWAPIFNQLINSATNTEAVHDSLADFLPSDRYFRFNPSIESMGIDEVRAIGRWLLLLCCFIRLYVHTNQSTHLSTPPIR